MEATVQSFDEAVWFTTQNNFPVTLKAHFAPWSREVEVRDQNELALKFDEVLKHSPVREVRIWNLSV